MSEGRSATCGHPDRPRKVKSGLCASCYARDRYRNDPDVRDRVKARSREHHHRKARKLTPEQVEARRKRARTRYAKDPRPVQSTRLKSTFGITLDQYEEMFAQQGGACAICKREPWSDRRFAVDHDHSCCPGKKSCGECIRGILCPDCNRALGFLRDDRGLLREVDRYLEHWGS